MDVFYYVIGSILTFATLIAGVVLKFFPPKNINRYFGIKTKTTSKSQKAWDYAHKICANTLLAYSLFSITLYVVLLAVNPPFIRNYTFVVIILGFILAILGVVIATIIVEAKTKKLNREID